MSANQWAESAAKLGRFLQQRQWRLATAESCTAGGIGYAISAIAGSSDWLSGGIISYSNELKQNLLGVPSDILHEHGAVSAQVAEAMAEGARRVCNADIAIAVTGIAGPTGATADKPVGLVWFGLATAKGVQSWRHVFTGDRAAVREQTISEALASIPIIVK